VTVFSSELDPLRLGLGVSPCSIPALRAIHYAGLRDFDTLTASYFVVCAIDLNVAEVWNTSEFSRKKEQITERAEIYAFKHGESVADLNKGCEFRFNCSIRASTKGNAGFSPAF
jgi:hypothetical protein